MKRSYVIPERYLKEGRLFYRYTLKKKVDYNNYTLLCESARAFCRFMKYNKDVEIKSPIPVLTFSSIAMHRGHRVEKVVTRDMTRNESVWAIGNKLQKGYQKDIRNHKKGLTF